ncbi:hypothetical protein [Streptomyces tendae]|uniref:hypothetical protein n=1 Tax=Streptomyces tendae TaxID=1932 RepID=UPI00380EF21B
MVWEGARLAFEWLQQCLAHCRGARRALEALFVDAPLLVPLTLCPSTTTAATARDWLTWTAAGLEGLCFKRLSEPYRAGIRAWGNYKVRAATEAVVGAVTGSAALPRTLLLGRYDDTGMLCYTGLPLCSPALRRRYLRAAR